MATVAASRVDVKIAVDAEGNASRVVKETRDQLDGLGNSAKSATDGASAGFGKYAGVAQQSLSRIGGAVSAINAVLGGTTPELQKIGQGFTAAGAVANTIPGPIGLAAAAVVGLSVATYEFAKAAAEAEARSKFMRGGAGSEGLAESIGISQKAVNELRIDMEDLAAEGIEPNKAVLRDVRDRAVAMGEDGEKAVLAYVRAMKGGAKELRAFQATGGDLGVENLKTLEKEVGLFPNLIQAEKDRLTIQMQAMDVVDKQAKLRAEETKNNQTIAALQAELASARVSAASIEKEQDLARLQRRNEEIEKERASNVERARAINVRSVQESAADQAKLENINRQALGKERIAQLEVDVTQATSLEARQAAIVAVINEKLNQLRADALDLQRRSVDMTSAQVEAETAALQTRQQQIQAETARQAKALADERRRRGEAAAAKNRERIDAETAATIKLAQAEAEQIEAKSKDPALDDAVIRKKLQVIDLEEEAARRAAARRVNTAQGRANELAAIELAAFNKRQALTDAETKKREQNAADVVALKREQFEQELQAEIETQAKIDELTKAQTDRSIEDMRSRGDFHAAMLAEIQAAEAQTAANIAKINQELAVKLTGLDEDSALAAKERQLAEARIAAEQQSLAVKTSEAYAKQSASTNEAIDKQIGTIDRITSSALQAGGLSDIGKGMAGLASNVLKGSAAFDQFNQAAQSGNLDAMAKANEGLSGAIDGTITASGAAAAAFVDDEKTKAGILALTETAASIASFATGNVVGGIGHAASAAIYAGIAGGAIPAGGGAAAGGATTGGGGPVTGETGAAGGGGGGGVTQVFNFNKGFVVGSTQEVAKGISGTLNSVNGTGYDRRKAA